MTKYNLTADNRKAIVSQMELAEQRASKISATIRCNRLDWSTVSGVASSLRLQLVLRSQWLDYRRVYVRLCQLLQHETTSIKDGIEYTTPNLRRHSSGGFGAHAEGERTLRTDDVTPNLPNADDVNQVATWVRQCEKLGQEMQSLYNQCERGPLLLPAWGDIKKHCPKGGREAYSALSACEIGKLDMTKAGEHKLFGWHIGRDDKQSQVIANLRSIRKEIYPVIQRKGKAPSRSDGFELLKTYRAGNKLPDNLCKGQSREVFYRSEFKRRMTDKHFLGDTENITPSLVMRMFREGDAIGLKTLKAIGVNHCHPGVVILGRVERIEGDITAFSVPACWIVRTNEKGWNKYTYKQVDGLLLAKTGWNDVYHLSLIDLEKLQDEKQELTNGLVNHIERECLRRGLDCAEVLANRKQHIAVILSAVVNQASEHHFEYQRRQAEYALSQLQRDALRKKRLAHLLVKLRKVETITLADSYEVGNCAPGTKQFCQRLGIASDSVSGRELAAKWRKASWSDWERFLPVAQRVTGFDVYSITG